MLLARILKERSEKWNGKGKFKEPDAPDTSGLPELPTGWCWNRLDSLAALKGGITKDQNRKVADTRKIPYLRVANVQRGNSFGQGYFMKQGKQTTNLASINLTKLSAFPVPLPPLAEQRRIVAEVERRLTISDKMEATITESLQKADKGKKQ